MTTGRAVERDATLERDRAKYTAERKVLLIGNSGSGWVIEVDQVMFFIDMTFGGYHTKGYAGSVYIEESKGEVLLQHVVVAGMNAEVEKLGGFTALRLTRIR